MSNKPKNYLCFAALLEVPLVWTKDTFYAILNGDGNSVTCYITSKTGEPKIIGAVSSVIFADLNLNSIKHSIASVNGNIISETVTSIQDFELNGNNLSITLNNESGAQQTLTVDISSIATEPVNLIEGTNITITGIYPDLTINAIGSGSGGQVDEVVQGAGINIDATDPTAPVVSLDSATQASLLLADSAVQVEADPVFTASEAFNIDASDIVNLGNLSGTNTGDQTSIVGISGTKTEFDTAVTDGDFMYVGDAPTSHTHTASEVTDFDTEVANNTTVSANTAAIANLTQGTHTGTVIPLNKPMGSVNNTATWNATYTLGTLVAGCSATDIIDTTGQVAFPTITGATLLTGSAFAATKIYEMHTYTYNGTNVFYYFLIRE